MDDLEGCFGVQKHETNFSVILGSSISSGVNGHAVADLENFLGNSFFLIRLEYLEQSRNEGGSDHLVLKSLGV